MSETGIRPQFDRAIAVLQDFEGDEIVWLFRQAIADPWAPSNSQADNNSAAASSSEQTKPTVYWELPWFDRLERESYRETIARELDWQFGLDRKKDFIVCSTPWLNLVVESTTFEVTSREQALAEGAFGIFEIYPIQLYGRRARGILDELANVQFLQRQQLNKYSQSGGFTRQTESLLELLEAKR